MFVIDRVLTALRLAKGAHSQPGPSMCIMECEAYIAGEAHSDAPKCVCPTIAALARGINDRMTQEERDELLAPMLGQFAGTAGTEEHLRTRRYISADYAVRVFLPIAMRARKREDLARLAESCDKIVDKRTALEAHQAASKIRAATHAYAAAAAAYAAADAAADAAAYAAAYAAAAAAADAADAADAARKARREVMVKAVQMLNDMIAVYSEAPKEWARSPESLPCLVK